MNKQRIFTIGDGIVKIKDIYVGLPVESAKKILYEQGFVIMAEQTDRVALKDIKCLVLKGNIETLGVCKLTIWGDNSIGRIDIKTEKKYSEEEMMEIFNQVKEELPDWPRYDYNGFGVSPKVHEINHFWDFEEGFITIKWDGGNVNMFSHNKDGKDNISFEIMRPIVKDEAYWRSEVD